MKNSEMSGAYEPMDVKDINTKELILAVKIRNPFTLDTKEDENHSMIIGTYDEKNLKDRTLGCWKISVSKAIKVKYIIGISTGAENIVVSAYEVFGYETDGNRVCFFTKKTSKETLDLLGLTNKSLPGLKFGYRAEKRYITIK
ncbi:MAG: hypothetical protein LBQ95_00035 [Lachnospiraceae bacterium]|jgi:hypothetical protein|nr:hypothetical protein [Lachnospiraceae bacterium]